MIMNLNGIEILEFADSLPTGIWDAQMYSRLILDNVFNLWV